MLNSKIQRHTDNVGPYGFKFRFQSKLTLTTKYKESFTKW